MNFGSLFSGIGGFDLALERAGMTCAWQCEIDPKASDVLKRHWPNVTNIKDVKHVRSGRTATVGLICGGFPCQDLSVAGKRAGLVGERSGLFYEFARIADEFAPGWILAENVPGLLSSNDGKDFAIVIGGFTGIIPQVPAEGWRNAGIAWGPRYSVAWRILDAQYFGVAQRRRRVFIVGSLGNGRCAEVLFEREGMFGDPPARGETGERPASPIEASSPSRRNGGSSPTPETFVIRGGGGQGGKGYLGTPDAASTISGATQYLAFDANQDGSDAQTDISPTLMHNGDSKSAHGAYGKIGVTSFIPGNSAQARSLGEVNDISVPVRGGGGGTIPAVAYNIQANDGGDHKRKDRPNGGLYVNETDKALTVGGTDLTAVVQPEVAATVSSKWAKQAGGPAGDEAQNLVFDARQITSKEHRSQPSEISQPLNQAGEMSVFGTAWEMSHASEVVREAGDMAPTLQQRMGTGGNQVPMVGVRRLTPTECERLQGFPDGWTAGQADSTRYRQLGNAVAVPVVEWIARRIMALEEA